MNSSSNSTHKTGTWSKTVSGNNFDDPGRVVRILDLCCREQTVRKAAETVFGRQNVQYTGVDNNPQTRPTVCADIMHWQPPVDAPKFDIIWAAPPCTSCPPSEATKLSRRCLDIIDTLNPTVFFIENLATGKLTSTDLHRTESEEAACYVIYGPPYKKVAHIWSNATTFDTGADATCVCATVTERMIRRAKECIYSSRDRNISPYP